MNRNEVKGIWNENEMNNEEFNDEDDGYYDDEERIENYSQNSERSFNKMKTMTTNAKRKEPTEEKTRDMGKTPLKTIMGKMKVKLEMIVPRMMVKSSIRMNTMNMKMIRGSMLRNAKDMKKKRNGRNKKERSIITAEKSKNFEAKPIKSDDVQDHGKPFKTTRCY